MKVFYLLCESYLVFYTQLKEEITVWKCECETQRNIALENKFQNTLGAQNVSVQGDRAVARKYTPLYKNGIKKTLSKSMETTKLQARFDFVLIFLVAMRVFHKETPSCTIALVDLAFQNVIVLQVVYTKELKNPNKKSYFPNSTLYC